MWGSQTTCCSQRIQTLCFGKSLYEWGCDFLNHLTEVSCLCETLWPAGGSVRRLPGQRQVGLCIRSRSECNAMQGSASSVVEIQPKALVVGGHDPKTFLVLLWMKVYESMETIITYEGRHAMFPWTGKSALWTPDMALEWRLTMNISEPISSGRRMRKLRLWGGDTLCERSNVCFAALPLWQAQCLTSTFRGPFFENKVSLVTHLSCLYI